MKIGDIVRTPPLGVYGNQAAIVTAIRGVAITIHTGAAELVYVSDDLTLVARIDRETGMILFKQLPPRTTPDVAAWRKEVFVWMKKEGMV